MNDPFGDTLSSVTAPDSGTLFTFTPDCIAACTKPRNLHAENATTTSIDLAWNEMGTATAWEVAYGPAGFTPGDASGNTVTATSIPYTLANLTPLTIYDIYVRSDCGGDYSPWDSTQAHTLFDLSNQCEYVFALNDEYGDGWNGGYLLVKQNGITVAQVNMSSGSTDTTTVGLCNNIPAELEWHSGQYGSEVSFTMSDPSGDTLYSVSEPAAGTLFTFTPSCIEVCPPIAELPYFEDFEGYTGSTTAATGVEPDCWELVQADVAMPDGKQPQLYYKSSFAHSGNYSLFLNYRGIYAMPEISSEITLNKLQIEMYLRQANANYQLEVGVWEDDGTFVPVTLIDNSSTNVEYVVCDFSSYTGSGRRIAFHNVLADGVSQKNSNNYIDDIVVKRICDYKTIPYSENFESYTESTVASTGVEPKCWELVQADVSMPNGKQPQLYYKSSFAHSGNYSLFLNYRGIYAMPELAPDIALNTLQLEMYLRQANANYLLEVGVWEDDGTFVPVALFNNSTTGVEYVVCDFSSYTGSSNRIAFRNVLAEGVNQNNSNNYIDDIALRRICEIRTLPYSEDFESYTESTTASTGVEPKCWELVQADVAMPNGKQPQLYYKSSFAHSGSYSLFLNYRGIYAMPELAPEIELNTLQLEMYLRQANANYRLEVGVWEDDGTFVPVALFNNSTTSVEYVSCDFSSYTGLGRRIAFRNVLAPGVSQNNSNNYIDDITLNEIPVTVECDSIASLPYTENFDTLTQSTTALTGVEPLCWELVHSDVATTIATRPQLYYNSSFAHSGNYSLALRYRGIYAMPAIASEIPLNTLRLEMYVRQAYTYNQLQVGVWEDDNTFTPVALVNNSSTGVEHVEVDFSSYAGSGHRIAFRNVLQAGTSSNGSYNYIDDITLSLIPADECPEISTLPYTENFDTLTQSTTALTGVEPLCWELVHSDVSMPNGKQPQLYCKSSFAHSGSYSLFLNYRGVYAMPELAPDIALNTLQLDMYLRQANANYQLEVGVWEDNGTFVPVALFNNNTTSVEHVVCDFSSYSGPGRRIAFHNVLAEGVSQNNSNNYLDDISLSLIPSKITEAETGNGGATSGEETVADNQEVGATLGVDGFTEALENLAVYPNPTNGQLHIDAVDVTRVECYSQMGQLVAVFEHERDLDISHLSSGVYMLRVTLPQGVAVRKIVKN
jgi:hypothetical protein